MSLSQPAKSSALLPVTLSAVLLGVGAAVAFIGVTPALWQIVVLVVCATAAAGVLILPALRAERRSSDNRAARDAKLAELSGGMDAALASLHAATAQAQLLTEQNRRQQSLVDELAAKLDQTSRGALEKIEQSTQAGLTKLNHTATTGVDSLGPIVEQAVSRLTSETENRINDARVQLEKEAARVAGSLGEHFAPVARQLSEATVQINKLETLRADIVREAAGLEETLKAAKVALTEADRIAVIDIDAHVAAARAALDAERLELTTLSDNLESRLNQIAATAIKALRSAQPPAPAQPVQAAAAPEPVVEKAPATEPVAEQPIAPPAPEPAAEPVPEPATGQPVEPPASELPAAAEPASPATTEPSGKTEPTKSDPVVKSGVSVNPVHFAAERAYDDLASAMDDALSS